MPSSAWELDNGENNKQQNLGRVRIKKRSQMPWRAVVWDAALWVPRPWYKRCMLGCKRNNDYSMQGITQQPCNSTGTARNRMDLVISLRLQLPFIGGLGAVWGNNNSESCVRVCVHHVKFTEPGSMAIRISEGAFSLWIFLYKKTPTHTTNQENKRN